MSSSFKTLALRLPRATSSSQYTPVLRCCSKASFSTAAQRPVCLSQATGLQQSTSGIRLKSSGSRGLDAPAKPTPILRLIPGGRQILSPTTIASQARCFASATAPAASSSAASASNKSALDWNSFFTLRLRRRRIQLLFSVTTGLLGGAGGAILLSTGMAEPLVMQVPLDPFVTLGLMTLACAGMGWLIGPSIGNQVFYLINHRFKAQMMQKETEFFARVKKHRVDPTNSSAGNPGMPYWAHFTCAASKLTIVSQFPTFTAKRSRVSLATGNGSRTSGHSTKRRHEPLYNYSHLRSRAHYSSHNKPCLHAKCNQDRGTRAHGSINSMLNWGYLILTIPPGEKGLCFFFGSSFGSSFVEV